MDDTRNGPVEVFEKVTLSIGRLYSLGGISLVLSGVAAVLLLLTIIFSALGFDIVGQLGQNASMFLVTTLVIGVAGALIGGLERLGEYRLAARRMDMMATLTEILVRSAIPPGERLTPNEVRVVMSEAYDAVWRNSTLSNRT
jgi:hypothetical protein